jgi:hypothetical protein
MSADDGADVPLGGLSLKDRVGDGGQGEVFDVAGPGRLLYKSYREPHKADGGVLADLVALRQQLGPAERDRLDRETAWPLCRVVDGGRATGFLMRRAPDSMTWRTTRGDTRLIELSYLLREPKAAWQAVPQPSPAERYALVVAVVELLGWMHALGLVDRICRSVILLFRYSAGWADEGPKGPVPVTFEPGGNAGGWGGIFGRSWPP